MQEALLIIGGNSTITSPVTRELKFLLQGHYGSVRHISSLADTATTHGINITQKTTILSLSDVDAPFSQTVTESSLQSMKQVLHSAGSTLWVAQGRQADNSFANMTVGLVWSVLLEVPTLAFQFLNFKDFGALQANVIAETLVRFKASLDWNLHKRGSDSQSRERPVMLMTVKRELVVDKQGQVLIPRMYPAKDMNERYNSGIRPIFGTTPIGREDGVVLKRDRDRGEFHPEDEKQTHPDSLRVTYSLLLAHWIKGLGHAHISLLRDMTDNSLQILLSNHLASTISPIAVLPPVPIDSGEHFLKNSESKGLFLFQLALNLLAISIIADISKGESLMVHEPEPAFAAILEAEAEDREVGLTIITFTLSSTHCEFLG